MERTKQKSKKDKPNKYLEKEKSSSFISDVKAFKENLKIREILKTVKMNSSMRIKAPRGSKVMQNKDFNDNDDIFDDVVDSGGQQVDEPPSATNTVLNNQNESEIVYEESIEEEKIVPPLIENKTDNSTSEFQKSTSLCEGINHCSIVDVTSSTPEFQLPPVESAGAKSRDRKLSLDHTMLLRREGFSQSEVDLNSIGKSPLERKSSFFRKKMDSFVRNTTEIFKRQSMSSKSTRCPVTSRRDSTSSRMSVSLQSLNEDSTFFEEFKNVPLDTYRDHQSSVSSVASPRTDSTLSNENDRLLEQAEVDTMAGSPLPEDQLADTPSTSTYSLNKEPIQDSLLNTRAISMSSGLDTATGQRRRKTSKSNRVSWLASDSLTDYFRRLIQDEKSKDIQGWQSYQDFSAIPENRVGPKVDSKGRRLSYMRAVSGEDPSLAASFRKKKLMENEVPSKPTSELEKRLALFSQNGIPVLSNYGLREIPEEARRFLQVVVTDEGFARLFPRRGDITPVEATQQAILQELVVTEAQYIQYLKDTVDVYMATALSLQEGGFLLYINSSHIFTHMPDIYNSSMMFWELVIYPMLRKAIRNGSLLDPNLIVPGLYNIQEIFRHYEEYMLEQTASMEYLRNINFEPDFSIYINWCNHYTNNRLQLQDILIKPMQRLTKYGLIIARLRDFVEEEETLVKLKLVERLTKTFVTSVNRAVRQKEELLKLDEMRIDPFEPEYKGEEEVEKLCKKVTTIDLHQPMIGCGTIGRCLIHQGMVRYKDSTKEFDAHLLLFTDFLLICKKITKIKEKDKVKKEYTHWRMLRPKIMMERLLPAKNKNALSYILLDEMGSAVSVLQISESSKDSLGGTTPKMWGMKIFEAMVTYVLTKWYVKNPPYSLDEVVYESFSTEKEDNKQDIEAVEKRSRERIAAMLYKKNEEDNPSEAYSIENDFQLRLLMEYAKHYDIVAKIVASCPAFTAMNTERQANQPDTKSMLSEGTVSSPSTVPVTAVTPRRRSSMAAAIQSGIKGPITKDADIERQASQVETKSMISEGTVSHSSRSTPVPVVTPPRKSSAATGSQGSEKKDPAKEISECPNIRAIFETGISHKIKRPQPPSTTHTDTMSSTGSSMMPSELRQSISHGSYEETRPLQRSGSSLERSRPAFFVEDLGCGSPGIKVHMIPENNNQTQLLSPRSARTPTLVLQESSPNHSPETRSVSAGGSSVNTLRVASDVTLVHSMPDINTEIRRVLSVNLEPRPIPLTASERLYRSHQELMQKNRLAAGQHYLKPDSRGSSYPPPSPRALQRGDAVSFSFRYPPLTRDKNVPERASTSQLNDHDTTRISGRRSPQSDRATGTKSPRRQRASSPIPRAVRPPGGTPENKSLFLRRNKESEYQEPEERDAGDEDQESPKKG